jgi:site-specific recombinase XerD
MHFLPSIITDLQQSSQKFAEMKNDIQQVTFNIVLDSRSNSEGLFKVLFRLKQGKVKRDIFTKIRWPKNYFDKARQCLLSRFEGDPDVIPFNLQLNEFKAASHRIQLNGFVKKTTITIEDLVKEFHHIGKSDDLFLFMETKINELYNSNVIAYGTWKRHRCSMNIIKEFHKKSTLNISQINLDWIQKYDAWARKVHKAGHNTVCGYHKDLKKYLTIAVQKFLIEKNPYEGFSFAYVDGDRDVLTQGELKKLFQLYKSNKLSENQKEICARFLFSCITGLRISDTSQLTDSMISGNILSFVPYKGRAKGKKLKIPLSKTALQLLEGRTGKLFHPFSHGYINETLKHLAIHADIDKRLTYHVARDTFGTLFIEMGGDVKSLKDIMGHASLATTMIYLKMSDKRKQGLMDNFDIMGC